MKNIILILAIVTCSVFAAEPYDLVKNRQVYEEKQKQLTQQYVGWLKAKTKESNGASYAAYKKELDSILESGGNLEKEEEEKTELEDGKRVRIDAKEGEYRIGNLKKGDVVQVQYVQGIWTSYPDWEMESPENPKIGQHKLYFTIKDGDVYKVRIPILKTKEKIFEYTLEEDNECHLIMGGAKLLSDNNGSVIYKINVIEK